MRMPNSSRTDAEKLHNLSTESSYGIMSALDICHGVHSTAYTLGLVQRTACRSCAYHTASGDIPPISQRRSQPLSVQLCRQFLSQNCDCIPTRCMSLFTASETLQLKSATCAHLPADSLPAGAIATTLLQILWLQSLQGLHRRWPLRCLCCRTS